MDSKVFLPNAGLRHLLGAFLSLIAVPQAWSQSGTVPTYISSMTDYQVVQLDGALVPTSGKVSMQSVTPTTWLTGDPSTGGLRGVIIAWSGGAKATGVSTLFVHGGGHSDGANNGLYVYDFAGTSKPTGWQSPLVISALSDIIPQSPTYANGYPVSAHTYDGAVYASHNNFIYRFMGSIYAAGDLTRASFKYNVATKAWTRVPDFPAGGGAAVTLYDPVSGKIFVSNFLSSASGYFFRTQNDTWSGEKNIGNALAEAAGAWDPTRSRGVFLDGSRNHLVSLNFSAETASSTSMSLSGATEVLERGMSAVYDPARDSYWLFGGPASSPGWTKIYELSAGGPPWTIVAHTLTGAPIQRTSGMVGSYGRFVLMDQWRAIGVVASETSAAYVIKLPMGSVARPNSPTNLVAN
jgi:hypothetical protein